MFSPKFKANPPKAEKTAVKKLSKEKSPPLQIIWTPNGASANPDQKRFRPINFSSPSLSRKKIDNKTSISPPWSEDGDNDFESFYTNEKKGYMSEPDQNNKTHHVDRTLNRTQLHEISRSKPYHKICPTILNTSKYNLNLDKSQSFTMKPEPKRGLVHQKIVNRSAEGNLSRALLKEQGYDSDSTIVFHKKADSETALLSPIEQRLAYRRMQAGGEPPLQGFRKTVAIEINKDQQKINFDDQINIHYKTPIRLERKEFISEDELMNQQADHMKKVYQDEKKRKHMQEIQNLDSRRHTDNFTPSQKSPISLNRYDDFPVEHTAKSRNPTRIVSRALYNFTGQSPRELTFKKSDLIYIRRKVDQNWYEGELHANLGLVPINYVEILSKNVTVPYKMQSQPLLGKARAKFTFIAQTDLELPLKKGELVTITRKIDDNWFEGKIGEQKGIFPVAYVEVLMMDEPFQTKKSDALMTCQQSFYVDEFLEPHKMLKERKNIKKTEILHIDTDNEPIVYKAMFSYKPQNGDELELLEGDTIYVLEKCDDGWYVGTSERTNLFGTFPGNYVKRI